MRYPRTETEPALSLYVGFRSVSQPQEAGLAFLTCQSSSGLGGEPFLVWSGRHFLGPGCPSALTFILGGPGAAQGQ